MRLFNLTIIIFFLTITSLYHAILRQTVQIARYKTRNCKKKIKSLFFFNSMGETSFYIFDIPASLHSSHGTTTVFISASLAPATSSLKLSFLQSLFTRRFLCLSSFEKHTDQQENNPLLEHFIPPSDHCKLQIHCFAFYYMQLYSQWGA